MDDGLDRRKRRERRRAPDFEKHLTFSFQAAEEKQ